MAIFDRLARVTNRSFDRMYSVAATIDCMSSTPNGRPTPDPERGEIHVCGIFDQADEYAQLEIGARDRKGNDLHTLATGQRYQFSLDVARYPAAKGVKQGDRLTLDDARRFEVLSLQPDGMARVVLILAIARKA